MSSVSNRFLCVLRSSRTSGFEIVVNCCEFARGLKNKEGYQRDIDGDVRGIKPLYLETNIILSNSLTILNITNQSHLSSTHPYHTIITMTLHVLQSLESQHLAFIQIPAPPF